MQLDKTTIELNKIADNIFKLSCGGKDIKFWTPKLLIPFGIETEYNKKVLKLELLDNNDAEQTYFKNIHKCNYCEEQFTRSTTLKRHLLARCKIRKEENSDLLKFFL